MRLCPSSVHLGDWLGSKAQSGAETGGGVGKVPTPKSFPRNYLTEGILIKHSSPKKPSPTFPLPLAPSSPQDLGAHGKAGGRGCRGRQGCPADLGKMSKRGVQAQRRQLGGRLPAAKAAPFQAT